MMETVNKDTSTNTGFYEHAALSGQHVTKPNRYDQLK